MSWEIIFIQYTISHILLYCLFLGARLHSVCQHYENHTNKVRGSISVSHDDTFINDRSTRPCCCSITPLPGLPVGNSACVVCERVFVLYCLGGSNGSQVYGECSWSGQQH